MSRMTNVRTTFAKNSEERRSLSSRPCRTSGGNAAYRGESGWHETAFVCSSRICTWLNNFASPSTYVAGESKLFGKKQKSALSTPSRHRQRLRRGATTTHFLPFVNLSNCLVSLPPHDVT